jgi:hypothetical protein
MSKEADGEESAAHALSAGVQGMKEHKGELWGIENLFKETADKVNALEIFEQERRDLQYRIQEYDTLGKQPQPDSAHFVTDMKADELLSPPHHSRLSCKVEGQF